MWGEGRMDSLTYDTSWLARLGDLAPDLSLRAREWLRANQHPDGTWGSDYVHAHDRVISTLAAAIALREIGDCRADEEQVQSGLRALPRYIAELANERQDTIGYEVIATALITHAQRLGLNVPPIPINTQIIIRKVNALRKYVQAGLKQPILYSAEALIELIPDDLDWRKLIDWDGAVSGSPAATIAVNLRSGRLYSDSRAFLEYWRNPDGGIGTLPIEI